MGVVLAPMVAAPRGEQARARVKAGPGYLDLTGMGRSGERRLRVPQDVADVGLYLDPDVAGTRDQLLLLDGRGITVVALNLVTWVPRAELPPRPHRQSWRLRPRPAGPQERLPVPWPLDACLREAGLPTMARRIDLAAPWALTARPTEGRGAWFGPALIVSIVGSILGYGLIGPMAWFVHNTHGRALTGFASLLVITLCCVFPILWLQLEWGTARGPVLFPTPDHAPGVLRPWPVRAVTQLFCDRCRITVLGRDVVVTTVTGGTVVFAGGGPAEVTHAVVRTAFFGEAPVSLDLCAANRTLARLPWGEWFGDNTRTRAQQCLGIRLIDADADADDSPLLPGLLADLGEPVSMYPVPAAVIGVACAAQGLIWTLEPAGALSMVIEVLSAVGVVVIAVAFHLAGVLARQARSRGGGGDPRSPGRDGSW